MLGCRSVRPLEPHCPWWQLADRRSPAGVSTPRRGVPARRAALRPARAPCSGERPLPRWPSVRRPARRRGANKAPIRDGSRRQARFGKMPRQHFRLSSRDVGSADQPRETLVTVAEVIEALDKDLKARCSPGRAISAASAGVTCSSPALGSPATARSVPRAMGWPTDPCQSPILKIKKVHRLNDPAGNPRPPLAADPAPATNGDTHCTAQYTPDPASARIPSTPHPASAPLSMPVRHSSSRSPSQIAPTPPDTQPASPASLQAAVSCSPLPVAPHIISVQVLLGALPAARADRRRRAQARANGALCT